MLNMFLKIGSDVVKKSPRDWTLAEFKVPSCSGNWEILCWGGVRPGMQTISNGIAFAILLEQVRASTKLTCA